MGKLTKKSSGGGFQPFFVATLATAILFPLVGLVLAFPLWCLFYAVACKGARETIDENHPTEQCDKIALEMRKKTGKRIIEVKTKEWTDAPIPLPWERTIKYKFDD